MARSRMALLRGRVGIPGRADIKLLDVIALGGIGKHYDGKTLVTGVRHRINGGGWRTDVQVGLSPERFSQRSDIRDVPAAGLLPAVSGLQLGTVAKIEAIRTASCASRSFCRRTRRRTGRVGPLRRARCRRGRGSVFRPAPGDEVVVGFLNDDPRSPVILGALFGSRRERPRTSGIPTKTKGDRDQGWHHPLLRR